MRFSRSTRAAARDLEARAWAPVPRSALPCGNISPLGVTGTPVIDERARRSISTPRSCAPTGRGTKSTRLSLADGSIEPGWPVDVATALGGSFAPTLQNQRGALALFEGKVFVPFSGHWGDCGAYHGYVVGVSIDDPGKVASFSTRARGGGIWAQGGVSSDGKSLFVATGNTVRRNAWSDGEAVLRLAPDLAPPDRDPRLFRAVGLARPRSRDLDLGGTAPIPLDVAGANGARKLIFAIGKSGEAYLLDRDNLGGIGGALATAHVATNIAIASPAVWSAADGVFVALQGNGAHCPPDKPAAGLDRAQNSRRSRARDRDRLVRFGRPHRLADRHDHRRPLRSDRVGRRRRGRQQAARVQGGHRRAARVAAGNNARIAPFSDAHRRRGPTLRRRRRRDLRFRVLRDLLCAWRWAMDLAFESAILRRSTSRLRDDPRSTPALSELAPAR